NMPPAYQEQLAAPSCSPRSRTSTSAPRSASSTAQASPATPAPMTLTCMVSTFWRRRSRRRCRYVDLAAYGAELLGHLAHPLLLGFRAHFVRDAHRAELRPAHRAEVRHLVSLLGQRLVVESASRVRVQGQIELILPTEIETRPRDGVVAIPSAGMSLGEI